MAFTTAKAADSAFYEAFANGNHSAVMRVWSKSDDIVCVHPMGPRLTGHEPISASWVQILAGGPQRNFEIQLINQWGDDILVVHVVNEIISVPASNLEFNPVLATNVYRCIDGNWYMSAHHASIDVSGQLAENPTDGVPPTRH